MNQQSNNARTNQSILKLNNKLVQSNVNSPFQPISKIVNSNSGYSSSKVMGIVILVVVVVLLFVCIYWLYSFYSTREFQTPVETEVMPDVKEASTNFNVGNGSIPSSRYSNEYSISMWLNIDNYTYNYGKEKPILRRGDKGDANPEIILDAKTNDLIVRLKLQNGKHNNPLTISNISNISNFADIPANMQNNMQLTSNQEINGEDPLQHLYCAFKGDKNQLTSNSLESVGSNIVDYQTIQYQQENGCNNFLATLKPEEAMNIILERSISLKEKENFKSGGYYDIAHVNVNQLSNNSAPLESQKYSNDFFAEISGNEITPSKTIKTLKENFDSLSDLTDACAAVMLDMCKFASAMQSKANADNQVEAMNTAFQTVINALENSKNGAKTQEDINMEFTKSLETVALTMVPITTFLPLLNNFQKNLESLKILSSQSNIELIKFTTIQDAVNAKLTSMNCPLTLNGTNEIDITTNFYETFITMVKKSLFTYINNMSSGIQKTFPDLAAVNNTNASHIMQNMNPIDVDPTIGTCIARSIPLQKWVHVIVSVYNQVVDIFVDGQLASSCVLKGFPAISTNNVMITPDGGFAGKISRVIFSNTAMTVQHAKQLYYSGPVPSNSIWSMIPNWVWYGIIILIIIGISYSLFM